MQQDCTWITVHLIWYIVILPCWCNSQIWIPFGSPAPKLDIWSPQGVSVLINVASPNSRELIQLWFYHWHICLTPPPHPLLFPLLLCETNFLFLFLCVAAFTLHVWHRHMREAALLSPTMKNKITYWHVEIRVFILLYSSDWDLSALWWHSYLSPFTPNCRQLVWMSACGTNGAWTYSLKISFK